MMTNQLGVDFSGTFQLLPLHLF